MNSVESFSANYREARTKFLNAAKASGGHLETLTHPERGPDGEALFTDVASFGNPLADEVVVLIAGTHGVEGFCGSGAQIDLLRRGEIATLPDNVQTLMIHAINPYGFAWLRRTTHENIDLNRNWIDFDQPLPINLGYEAIHDTFCPVDWTATTTAAAEDLQRHYTERYGAAAFKAALSAGQYAHQDGLYFGGRLPSWSRLMQTRIFIEYLKNTRKVAIIDYHTGLGPWGFAEYISTEDPHSSAFARASIWFGREITSTVDGSSSGAPIRGDGLSAAAGLLPWADVTGIALEFGTIAREEIIRAARADNWLHVHGDPQSPSAADIKGALRRAYYGDRDDWKGMVAGQSLRVFRQAVAGLRLAGSSR